MVRLYDSTHLGPDHLSTLDSTRFGKLRKINSTNDEITHAVLQTMAIESVIFSFTTEAAYENVAIIYVRVGRPNNYHFAEVGQAGNESPRNLYIPPVAINPAAWSVDNLGGTGGNENPIFIFAAWHRKARGGNDPNPENNLWIQNQIAPDNRGLLGKMTPPPMGGIMENPIGAIFETEDLLDEDPIPTMDPLHPDWNDIIIYAQFHPPYMP